MIALDILTDGFFAAVAGIGFGAISDPPLRAFKMIAILAALGHACRFCLMTYLGMDIATGSLFAGLVIGFGSLWLGKKVYCPAAGVDNEYNGIGHELQNARIHDGSRNNGLKAMGIHVLVINRDQMKDLVALEAFAQTMHRLAGVRFRPAGR